jgi:hypothetical protein
MSAPAILNHPEIRLLLHRIFVFCFRICHCLHDAVRFYRNAVNAEAVIMQILMFYPQGCAIASPWALLCRAVGTGFQLTEASRNKQCFQFRLSLFSIFLRVLAQTVEEPNIFIRKQYKI